MATIDIGESPRRKSAKLTVVRRRAARRSSAAGPVTSADIEWAIAQVRQGSSSGNRRS